MEYKIAINKRFHYLKAYNILKKSKENVNLVSRLTQRLVDKYILKRESEKF